MEEDATPLGWHSVHKDKFLAQLMQANGGVTIGCMKLKEEERARMAIWLAGEEMLESALI